MRDEENWENFIPEDPLTKEDLEAFLKALVKSEMWKKFKGKHRNLLKINETSESEESAKS